MKRFVPSLSITGLTDFPTVVVVILGQDFMYFPRKIDWH